MIISLVAPLMLRSEYGTSHHVLSWIGLTFMKWLLQLRTRLMVKYDFLPLFISYFLVMHWLVQFEWTKLNNCTMVLIRFNSSTLVLIIGTNISLLQGAVVGTHKGSCRTYNIEGTTSYSSYLYFNQKHFGILEVYHISFMT